KKQGKDIVADVEGGLAFAYGNLAAFVGGKLLRIRVVRPQEPAQGQVDGDKTGADQKKDEDVGVCTEHGSPSPRRGKLHFSQSTSGRCRSSCGKRAETPRCRFQASSKGHYTGRRRAVSRQQHGQGPRPQGKGGGQVSD